ncbi:hypothetical protein [Ferruginibacter albus]|uniref:hypothetical protein n=1 Tax=Ferruginibacter albus TaxID=2875540 RepID=UPI001CC53A77|nr:hypothetical protein [Ferruginibacter albus]UAY50876.1 hypothetical protein K9M53_09770 [Ferruginibacter albus]
MPASIPLFITIVFIITTLITWYYLCKAIRYSFKQQFKRNTFVVFFMLLIWLGAQGFLANKGFYLNTKSFPPRFILAIVPALLIILFLFITKAGKRFIDNLPLTTLTYIHTVRILVETVLYWLFLSKAVPQVMTFAGRNLDIIAGITAPLVGYLYFKQKIITKGFLIGWNIISILLLGNIVIIAVLSAPFAFQKLGFEQPNIAVLYFPFIWLPCFIVPTILFSHLASIRQLMK